MTQLVLHYYFSEQKFKLSIKCLNKNDQQYLIYRLVSLQMFKPPTSQIIIITNPITVLSSKYTHFFKFIIERISSRHKIK